MQRAAAHDAPISKRYHSARSATTLANSPAARTCQHVTTSSVVPAHEVGSDGVLTEQQPRRPGADRPTVRALDRSLIHSQRARRRPPSALHAGPRRRSLQSRHEGEIRTPHRNRKTRKSRPDRDHAKACRPRKRPPKGKSHLDAKNRLINTDTLAGPKPVELWRRASGRGRRRMRAASATLTAVQDACH